LAQGDAALGIRAIHTADVDAKWRELDPHYKDMVAAAEQIVHASSNDSKSERMQASIHTLVEQEALFLPTMDEIVKLMENEAARTVRILRATVLAIAATVVALLVGLGWFVVRPATQTIRSQVSELEARVTQRTTELAAALASLQREIRDREQTELKNQRLAAQLAHADRVTTMGHLTAGVAHELNQPLAAIANYAEACDVELLTARDAVAISVDRLRNYLDKLKHASLRAGQIIRRMRNFVRPNAFSPSEVEADLLVTEIVELLSSEIERANVELSLDLTARDAMIHADAIQIQQVLANLVQNALQSLKSCPTCEHKLVIRTATNFDTVQYDVIDSGPGFVATDPEAAFAPFQTSKVDGLGIGLAICRSIVEQHQGTIWINSSTGQGAKISFALPLASQNDTRRIAQPDCLCR
jgi:two-component system sensor kinase FixL